MSDTAPLAAADCRLLAFDTSTEQMNLALITPEGVASVDLAGGALASARLLPELQAMLRRAGCALQDLDAIAYGCGPGAFTGLRTACSAAQGLAFGIGRPVVPVDSLMLVAESVRAAMASAGGDRVLVAQDARMDEIYAALYRWNTTPEVGGAAAGCWETLRPPALYGIDAFMAAFSQDPSTGDGASPMLAGSALEVFGTRLDMAPFRRIAPSLAGSRSAALASLALHAWRTGMARDAALALPLYLRDKVASTTAERDLARAAKAAA